MTNRNPVITDISAGMPSGIGPPPGGAGVPFRDAVSRAFPVTEEERAAAQAARMAEAVRLATLQEQVDTLIWLHAELAWRQTRMATMVASLMAEKMQPKLQKALLAQLTGMG